MKIAKKILIIIINLITIILSLFIKKTDKICVFGSWFGKNFSDNSKYLYLYLNKNKEKYGIEKLVWITDSDKVYNLLNSNGFDVEKRWHIKSIIYHMKAKNHFICQAPNDINSYFSAKSNRIQLWHGVGPKKVSDLNEVPNINSFKYKLIYIIRHISSPGLWYKYKFLSTSKFVTNEVHKFPFRLWENEVIEANYPRNIYLSLDETDKKYINCLSKNELEIKQLINNVKNDKNIILYVPTYRNDAIIENNKETSYPLNIQNEDEFKMFIDFINDNNILFFSKFHFAGDLSIVNNNENFYNLDENFDIYTILNDIDLLLTDYSSIYSDYLFIDKPIIFYVYDIEIYKNNDKGFICDFNSITPGDKAYEIEGLKEKIIYNLNNDDYFDDREKIKKLYFDLNINDTFESLLKKINKK